MCSASGWISHTGLVGGHHDLYVHEGVVSSGALQQLQSLRNQLPDVLRLLQVAPDDARRFGWRHRQTDRQNETTNPETSYFSTQSGSPQTVRLMSGLAEHHLWPRRTALLRTESANAILPSDFKPNGRTEFNLLLLRRSQLGLNGRRVFNCSAESLMRQPAERSAA